MITETFIYISHCPCNTFSFILGREKGPGASNIVARLFSDHYVIVCDVSIFCSGLALMGYFWEINETHKDAALQD